jgi:hypothetical protein
MEADIPVIFIVVFSIGTLFGYWCGVIIEANRNERRRRANLRARYGHPSNR